MSDITQNSPAISWIKGELELAGILDRRIINLLMAIERTGSINQAAKQVGLSYKGAWQIIERANNSAPKVLINTAAGGSKGGGTSLTKAGHALLALFNQLEQQHLQFLSQLNQTLAENSDTRLLLQRLAVKTSARNQLFGCVTAIQAGAVNAELTVRLAGGDQLAATIDLQTLEQLNLQPGDDTLILINDAEVMLAIEDIDQLYSARNRLICEVIRIQRGPINAEIIVSLAGGEILVILVTLQSAQQMVLREGMQVWAIFKSNAMILGVLK